jgi:hypothetical protein
LPFRQCLNSTMNNVAIIFRISNIDDGWRHKHRSASATKARVEEAKRAAVTGPFPQWRIINYIARPTGRSSAAASSRVT